METPAEHVGHHFEFAVYVIFALIMLYRPPRSFAGVQEFVEKHFGDSIGLYILHLGIALVILGGVWPDMTQVSQIGQSLILAAMGVLKLTKAPPNGTEMTVTSHTPEPLPAIAAGSAAKAGDVATPVPAQSPIPGLSGLSPKPGA